MSIHVRAAAFAVATSLPALLAAQALEVRNNGDHVVVPHSSALVPTNLTIEAWIEIDPSATDLYGTIARKNVNTAEAYLLRVSKFQRSTYGVEFNLTTTTGGTRLVRSGTTIPLGTPTHLAATYDGNQVRVYQDGVLVANSFISGAFQDSGNELWIGEGDTNNPIGETFQGRIDALRIWDTARTPAELDETNDVELTSAPGLVAAWNFDCDLTDSTGNGHDAAGFNGGDPTYADEFVSFAGALDLDSAGDLLTVAHDPALAPATVFVEAWCVLDSSVTSTYPTIVRKNVSSAEAYTLRLSSFQTGGRYIPEFNFTTGSGTSILRASSTTIPLDTPVHVAGSYDGTRARIYVNGEIVAQRNVPGSLSDTGGPLQIGLGDSANTLGEQFVGQIDAVRIWDQVPTSCEIGGGVDRELTDRTGLIAAWNFDGGLGDVTGNGHDAVGTGHDYAPEFATYAQALKTPTGGANGWVEVAHSPELVPAQFTIEGVYQVDPSRSNFYATIARKNWQTSEAYVLRAWPISGSTSQVRVEMNVTTTGGPVLVQATVAGDPYAPHHLAGTFDGSRVRLFLDGVEVNSRSTPTSQLIDTAGVFRIGQGDSNNTIGEQMEGRIDSVRLWNHARTAADIASTMDREIDSMPGLIAAWNFNGDLTDATGHGFDGTAVGNTELVDEFANLVGSDCSPIAYGAPTSNCAVKPRVFASDLVETDGRASYGCLDAPANGIGLYLFTSGTLPAPNFVDGLDVWVDTSALINIGVPAASDANGRSTSSFPISNSYSEAFPGAVQYFWLDGACGLTALSLTTSDALQLGPF